MSGSNAVAIVTPIVMLPLMAFWLIMVYHADRNPGYRHRPPMPVPDALAAAEAAARPEVIADQEEQAPAAAPHGAEQAGHGGKVMAGH